MDNEIEILKRQIAQEKDARQQAESLLDRKTLELYKANEDLIRLNESLERQISERTQALQLSEEKYRGIIENMDLGLIEVDNDDVIKRVYKRFSRLTGYEEHELVGKKAAEVLLPEDSFRRVIAEQNSNRLEGMPGVYEVAMRKKNGEIIWVIVSGAPIIDGKGNVLGSVGIHLDITERKRTQEALEDARQMAEDARRAEKKFLANMSHEIRTPINAIIGMTHLLYDTNPNDKQIEYFSAIHYSADLLLNLVSDILDISKIEAGEMQLTEQTFSLKDLINNILQTFGLRLKGKEVELQFVFDEEIENYVVGDSIFLTQILMNLLSNAVKFTEKGQIGIQVSLLCRLGDFLMTEIKVMDTGVGISPQNIEGIFESFRQANQDVKVKYGGTGLGLAIVKQLVNLHGGEISVESVVGEGTTFTFTLPLKDSGRQAKKPHSLTIENPDDWRKYRVLVVEDNLINQKYVEGLLSKWGLNYEMTNSGKGAIELLENQNFNLILMDIRMPEMNGYEATQHIREMAGNPNQNVPIVALTASALIEEIDYAYFVGINAYLTKPFTPDQLLAVLKQILPPNTSSATAQGQDTISEKTSKIELKSDYLEKIYSNDKKYAAEMFSLFLKTIPSQFALLRPLINDKNIVEIGKLAHQLKPSFTMVGLPNITQSLQHLEKMANQNDSLSVIEKLFSETELDFLQGINFVKNELEELKKC